MPKIPFGFHLKEHQNSKKITPTCLRITKEAHGARKVQVVENAPQSETTKAKVKACKGKDLCQMLKKKKQQRK